MSEEWLENSFDPLGDSEALREENTILHKQMMALQDFSARIDQNLSDPNLYQVIIDEFLIHCSADRVVILVLDEEQNSEIVVSRQACERTVKRVAVPYVLEPYETSYFEFLRDVFQTNGTQSVQWNEPVMIHPDIFISRAMAKRFSVEGEQGDWVICLQWVEALPRWEKSVQSLFDNMVQYAQVVVDQRQMRYQIEELQNQEQSFLACMPQALVALDLLGTVTLWSGQAEQILGLRLDEALGLPFYELFPEFKQIESHLPQLMDQDQAHKLEPIEFQGQKLTLTLFSLMSVGRGEIGLSIELF